VMWLKMKEWGGIAAARLVSGGLDVGGEVA
jgi:hypothetical protein